MAGMSEVKRILAPVDFSENSEAALKFAISLAQRLGAAVHLLHVLPTPVYGAPPFTPVVAPVPDPKYREECTKALNELAATHSSGVDVTQEVVEGTAHVEIGRLAGERKADMIVMGTHGRTGLQRLLLGSVAERVVRTATVPVLTVPLEQED